jgi:alcohol dehydrogenase class IV
MNQIKIQNPRTLVFGENCLDSFISDFRDSSYRRVFLLAEHSIPAVIERLTGSLESSGKSVMVDTSIHREPTAGDFNRIREKAIKEEVDSVIGLGGGSVMDIAKLTAATYGTDIPVDKLFGTGNVPKRDLYLACLPTTAGTGSEVSPNSILLDEKMKQKKGVISPFLVPDATYVDPLLTHTVPPDVTASTGIDALTHCIETFANRVAHPFTDLYALKGISLIYENLEAACRNGDDAKARSSVALGSMYGGICLGPVNTAGVHAMAYPLGGEFHIPHGLSNALLLLPVLEFNLSEEVSRYADMARAMGIPDTGSGEAMARKGLEAIRQLCRKIKIPEKLAALHISPEAVPGIIKSAMTVTRLLKNNLREITVKDALEIYDKLI